jgi:hypothetical protein
MVTVYKKISVNDFKQKVSAPCSADESQKINTTISNFVNYFKAKHLG